MKICAPLIVAPGESASNAPQLRPWQATQTLQMQRATLTIQVQQALPIDTTNIANAIASINLLLFLIHRHCFLEP